MSEYKKNDINGLDPNDEGLKQVMGRKFQDVQDTAQDEVFKPALKKRTSPPKTTAADAPWAPAAPTLAQKLTACSKAIAPIAVASVVVFWWQMSGQLPDSTAYPTLIFLAAALGLTIGKYMGNP